jgi:hypothetical protein
VRVSCNGEGERRPDEARADEAGAEDDADEAGAEGDDAEAGAEHDSGEAADNVGSALSSAHGSRRAPSGASGRARCR